MSITAQTIDDVLSHRTTLAGALGLSAGVVEVFAVLGARCYEQGRYRDARVMFEAAVALEHDSYLGHAGLGAVALVEERFDDSLTHLQRAYALNSKDPAVCGNLGEVCLRLSRPADAARFLAESAALDPGHVNPFANRARGMLRAMGIEATPAVSRR